ncbi:MAG: hypothetical protein RLZZ31_808 [Actinomycetota bacterium]
MADQTLPAHQLPLTAALRKADEELTGPGGAFETVTATVGGNEMLVFRNRMHSLAELLASTEAFGDRLAMTFSDGRQVTFTEFIADVSSVAEWMSSEYGISKGDRVALCAANCYGWIVSFWASLTLGAITVAMNGWWTTPEMQHAIDLTDPKLLLFDARRAERLEPQSAPVVLFEDRLEEMLNYAQRSSLPFTSVDEDDPAILIFTSGTTGRPKAAVLSHRSVIAYSTLQNYIAARSMHLMGITPTPGGPQPIRLAVFPLFHVSGLGATVNSLHVGATTAWYLGRFEADAVIRFVIDNKVNIIGGTGTHILRLLDHPDCALIPPQQVLSVGMGGSATTPEILRRLANRFPHLDHTMSTGYGSTETGALVSFAPNALLEATPECIGPPLPTVSVRICDENGNVLPEGEEGNICVKSPLVMSEYWRHPSANAEAFSDGYFNTGDFGRLIDGVLYIASRKRDIIIRGGENIYPFEIENCIEELPGVIETAVFGVDHDTLGQEVKAVIVIAPDATITEVDVHEHCKKSLAVYKIPAYVELRTERLPRNPSGKILKHVVATGADAGFVEE